MEWFAIIVSSEVHIYALKVIFISYEEYFYGFILIIYCDINW